MYGNGPLATLATIKEYLPAFRPRIVLWFYYEQNDLLDLSRERRSPLLFRYLERGFNQDLVHRRAELDAAVSRFLETAMTRELQSAQTPKNQRPQMGIGSVISFGKLSHLRRRLNLVSARPDGGEDAENLEPDELPFFQQVLQEAETTIDSWNGSLYFVYLPARDRYAGKQEYHRDLVMRAVADLRLPIIDVHSAFQARGDPLNLFPFRRFGHYNETGHRVVAEAVLQSISSSSVLGEQSNVPFR